MKKYVAPAIEAGLVPGGPAKPVAEWEELVRNWFPEMADTRLRQTTWPEIDKHRDYIVAMLAAGVSQGDDLAVAAGRARPERVGGVTETLCGGEPSRSTVVNSAEPWINCAIPDSPGAAAATIGRS